MSASSSFEQLGREVIQLEAEALQTLAKRLDEGFAEACRLVLACQGRVIVTGMGKSGHIGGKIAATLASTGTPSFFVHPGEASHGDLGMITPADIVLAISNSGETAEILTILPIIKRMGVKLIALLGNTNSSLARQADAILHAGVEKEACPHNLAPTASTTAALAIGDALAVTLLKSRGFTREDFARAHPAGSLGRRLLLYVSDVMHTGAAIPQVAEEANLREALLEMTGKGLGMTGVVNRQGALLGIFTDGDLRRVLARGIDVYNAKITDVMTRDPKTTRADRLAVEIVQQMQSLKINGLFVVDDKNHVLGALNMHDLFRAGII
ncbi:MAG: KpsF/GutQ family sugar-phosphate isomerase [Gammaproteobacteria bacterium]|nr:KpsF/GutQ family sugar-phosphate isomerase [Gammaproteobacteria bacterium]MBI5783689.1 KpsF/GutQ family sugar-phosphate isomerase [Gammaproteobacteria bacterium]